MSGKKWVFFGLILFSLFLIAAKYDYLLEMGDKTVKSSECDKCHKIIYEEWSKDAHSKAYTSDAFKKASKNYEMQECVSCHAPQQNADEKNLKARPVHQEEGVNCTTCHLRGNMIYGPYKLEAKHKSEQDESFLKSESCAGCHTPTVGITQASNFTGSLSNAPVNAFSDLEIHHMGVGLADNVSQGAAGGDQFRTAPLWGLSQRIFLLHDGRTTDLLEAIQAHQSQGSEATNVEENFDMLSLSQKQDLLNFLRSL